MSRQPPPPLARRAYAGAFAPERVFPDSLPDAGAEGPIAVGIGWAVEVKFDGSRLQLRRDEHTVCLRSRPGRDCTEEFPELAPIGSALGSHRVLIDGEVVCLGLTAVPTSPVCGGCGPRRIRRAGMPRAVRPPLWRSVCFTWMAARRASLPTGADASC